MARTSNHFEAEDLAQDIIVEIYKSADNIRNADAFYGFMWAVAGNVYKQWCKKKAKNKECIVLNHEINRGKGCALKTAFTYYKEKLNKDYAERNVACTGIGRLGWFLIDYILHL